MEHLDVLIVGAGLSGIGAACHLKRRCPGRSVAIVEGRERSGGTWDLFRYPGVRSDSDMYTLGYAFRPWRDPKAIAPGSAILDYIRQTAREHDVERLIRYRQRVTKASWSSATARWTVTLEHGDGSAPTMLTCGFLFLCCGYYRYDRGHAPAFEGSENYRGRIVHPQFWPEDLDWSGRRIAVIGSGATAMTLVPALAERAAQVTMVQRSPTWVVSRPSEDPLARRLRGRLPARWVHALTRWKQVLLGWYLFRLCRRDPERVKRLLLAGVRAALGPQAKVEPDFTPRYNPWEQRLCLLPDGDLFKAMRQGRATVVTDRIERFTETGLALASGRRLDADIVVSATGLELQVFGGIALEVDGHPVDPPSTFNYKGVMFSGLPNLASCFGYTNASWTLKSDLTGLYVCRLLNHMKRHGHAVCLPQRGRDAGDALPWVDFSSGYLQRSLSLFPKQGATQPWKLNQNYLRDLFALRFGRIDDGSMRFTSAA